ncbi:hypothetical protein Agsp01_11940 [Agromyces sp. NBRC 114283]|nr:hypothetical protein Agsp01_11940 [Agromyces sp. NBRC 114283]
MFQHHGSDAPEGTLAHAGYRLYLADLRFKAILFQVTGARRLIRWFTARTRSAT